MTTPYSRSQVNTLRTNIERGLRSNARKALSDKDINDLNRVIAALVVAETKALVSA